MHQVTGSLLVPGPRKWLSGEGCEGDQQSGTLPAAGA